MLKLCGLFITGLWISHFQVRICTYKATLYHLWIFQYNLAQLLESMWTKTLPELYCWPDGYVLLWCYRCSGESHRGQTMLYNSPQVICAGWSTILTTHNVMTGVPCQPLKAATMLTFSPKSCQPEQSFSRLCQVSKALREWASEDTAGWQVVCCLEPQWSSSPHSSCHPARQPSRHKGPRHNGHLWERKDSKTKTLNNTLMV